MSILGLFTLLYLSFQIILHKQWIKISLNNTTMWFLIFLFLVLSSLGNEFIFAKLLSIKEVGFLLLDTGFALVQVIHLYH